MALKSFHVREILAVSTGYNLSREDPAGPFYKVIGHIMNRPISTAGIVVQAPVARQFLHETLPWTKNVFIPRQIRAFDGEQESDQSTGFVGEIVRAVRGFLQEIEPVAAVREALYWKNVDLMVAWAAAQYGDYHDVGQMAAPQRGDISHAADIATIRTMHRQIEAAKYR